MATSTIRKAIGAVKDQTSISLAKVAGNVAPDLEVLVVKATSHDNEPADEKYAREILSMISHSRGYVRACISAISKRLSKTSDWIVALKALMLVQKLLNEGDPVFAQELMLASRKGARVLNMSDFRDYAHSGTWEHSGFVRSFALYLDQKLEFMAYERKLSVVDNVERGRNELTPVSVVGPERAVERLNQLLRLFDRFSASRPTGAAKNTRIVIVALYLLVKESFKLYAIVTDVLKYLHDCFSELEYGQSAKVFDAYVNASKMIDELIGVHNWCKDIAVGRSSEYPELEKISNKLLGSLEGQLREKGNRIKSPNEEREESFVEVKEEREQNMDEIKLSLHQNITMPPPPHHPYRATEPDESEGRRISPIKKGNAMALALFSAKTDDKWVDFQTEGEAKVTSAWQNPAAESGKADWELVLVESASHLPNQKVDLGGGLDPLMLNGMYDQGTVRQHVGSTQMNGGSASSVALPGMCKSATPVLALPCPDGTVEPVGHQDPFAASLVVPPPAYVQIADMERKQQFLTQEQQLWQQYASNGMQGQLGMAKISGSAGYGMAQHAGYGQPGGTTIHPTEI